MPFINSKISTSLTEAQETEIKNPFRSSYPDNSLASQKAGSWSALNLTTSLYFRGSNAEPIAMVEVSVYGSENPSAFF